MLSKYGVSLMEVESDEWEVEEQLVLGKRTLVPFGLIDYAVRGLLLSFIAGIIAAALAEHFLHASEGERVFYGVALFVLCALGFIAWLVARHNFQDFTSMKSEFFYYKMIRCENLESPGSQLMLGLMVENGEFEYGVAQIPKEHNKLIEATLLPGSPGVMAAKDQKIRRDDAARSAAFNRYMNKLMQENGGSYGAPTS